MLCGAGAGPVPEAEIMRRAAHVRSVPEAALLIEPASRNTFENAREAARLLRSRGLHSVLLVTDRAHLPRAVLLFRLAGLRVAGWAGVPPPSMYWEMGAAIHEFVALPYSLARALLGVRSG
jgi:uncharacterized SAM-binding protein YcdF (DUF218 family)